MPWGPDDADRFRKGLTARQRRAWLKVANAVLAAHPDDEGRAIRSANAAAGRVTPDGLACVYCGEPPTGPLTVAASWRCPSRRAPFLIHHFRTNAESS